MSNGSSLFSFVSSISELEYSIYCADISHISLHVFEQNFIAVHGSRSECDFKCRDLDFLW